MRRVVCTKSVKCAVVPYKTKYSCHWISPEGKDCLLGGSNDINDINETARKQAKHIFDNPWETNERKLHFLEELYVVEDSTERDAMLEETEDYINKLINEL